MDNIFDAIQIDRVVPIPLYYQLKKQLLGLIESKQLKPGDVLPAEMEFSSQLNVSRPTIRQAMIALANEGYLVRNKGKGTFVSQPKVEDRFLSKLESFNEEMVSKGLAPETEVLKLKVIPGIPEYNEKLSIGLNDPLLYLTRLRSIDGMQVVYLETYLSYNHYSKLENTEFTSASLYEQLESLYNVRICRAHRKIEATMPSAEEARILNIPRSMPLCLVRSIGYADDGMTPVEYSVARYRGDRTRFIVDTYR